MTSHNWAKLFIIGFLIVSVSSGCHYHEGFIEIQGLPSFLSWLKISTYGMMLAFGFITGNFLLQKEFTRVGLPVRLADNLIITMAIGGIIGAKLFFIWETSSEWSGLQGFFDKLFTGAGLTWYGGFIVAGLACYFLIRKEKLSFLRLADLSTPGIAMGYVFGRMGCLVSGDGCYGEACPYNWPAPFAMAFPNGAAQDQWADLVRQHGPDVVVYNTPFYEASFSLLLFAFFQWSRVRLKDWPTGTKFVTFIIFHSLFRFFVEFIRLNPRDVFGLSQAQFVSLVLVAISIGYLYIKRKQFNGIMT